MTTQHLAIAIAISNRFKAAGLAGGRVYVNRTRALGSDKDTAIAVRLGRSASQQVRQLGGRTTWNTLIEIECYGRDGAAEVPGTVADLVLEQVFDNLDSASDLGYGVMDIEPLAGDTLAWDFDQLDTSVSSISARFLVKHQTNGRTLKV
jgi:hypothetical protein